MSLDVCKDRLLGGIDTCQRERPMVTSGTLGAARPGVERKQRKRSGSTRLVGGVRCGVASGVLLSSHRSPPSSLASRLSRDRSNLPGSILSPCGPHRQERGGLKDLVFV